MKNGIKESFHRGLVRPLIYKALARFLYGLTGAMLYSHFFGASRLDNALSMVFAFLTVTFFLGAYLSHLRRTGVRIPRLPKKRLRNRKPEPFSDMSDHIDDPTEYFEELPQEERDLCLMLADGLVGLIFLILSLIV